MATIERTAQLNVLVELSGGNRKAEAVIKSVKGVAPTFSTINKARNGNGRDYAVQSYIDDLITALCPWFYDLSVRNKDGIRRLKLFDINELTTLVNDPDFKFSIESNMGEKSKIEISNHIAKLNNS